MARSSAATPKTEQTDSPDKGGLAVSLTLCVRSSSLLALNRSLSLDDSYRRLPVVSLISKEGILEMQEAGWPESERKAQKLSLTNNIL